MAVITHASACHPSNARTSRSARALRMQNVTWPCSQPVTGVSPCPLHTLVPMESNVVCWAGSAPAHCLCVWQGALTSSHTKSAPTFQRENMRTRVRLPLAARQLGRWPEDTADKEVLCGSYLQTSFSQFWLTTVQFIPTARSNPLGR